MNSLKHGITALINVCNAKFACQSFRAHRTVCGQRLSEQFARGIDQPIDVSQIGLQWHETRTKLPTIPS